MISEQEALAIAHEDAVVAYRDLDELYEPMVVRHEENWLVSFRLKDPGSVGGGPMYIIAADSGEIVSRRYAQ